MNPTETQAPAPILPYATDTAARCKIALVITKSVGSAILGVLMGSDWVAMTRQQQVMAVITVIVSVCVSLEALYDRTMASRAAGKAASGNTNPPFSSAPPKPLS